MSSKLAQLSETDFVSWTEQQAAALSGAAAAGANLPLDWENLDDSPSLRGEAERVVGAETPRAMRNVTRVLRERDVASTEVTGKIAALNYSADRVLGD